jgi:hypothetical protein
VKETLFLWHSRYSTWVGNGIPKKGEED